MRPLFVIAAMIALGAGLSGCAVASVAGAAVDVGSTVVSTTADVAGDAVGAAADTVSGSDDKDSDDKSSDDKKSDDN